ncbi:MAG: hypothetical protein ACM3ZC_01250 [Bacteroidota bacterium]
MNLRQDQIDRLLAQHNRGIANQPACCDGRYCLTGPCPETAKMMYNRFPRESVTQRLLAKTGKEAC